LGIQVHPNSKVYVSAPLESPIDKIKEKVKSKASWIQKQQEFFLSFHPLTPPRKYVSGETHLYLGRQYRLKVVQSILPGVKLSRGYIYVSLQDKKNRSQIERLLKDWYKEKADQHFLTLSESLLPLKERFSKKDVNFSHRWMKKRWGICSSNGSITLNTELIKAPKKCIEYVIVHELCHLAYLNHSRSFYTLLQKNLPDWRKAKNRLERFMV